MPVITFCVWFLCMRCPIRSFETHSFTNRWLFTVYTPRKTTWGNALPHLALRCALAVSSEAAGAAAGVPGARRLPGPLSGGPVVVEMPAAQVFVGLPVAKDVEGGAGGDGRQAGLRDLQLLEVSVDRRVGPALTCRRRCLVEERRKAERRSDHEQLFRILLKIGTSIFPCSSAHIP